MYLTLYLLLPLVIASDVINSEQNTRDVARPQRRNQRKARTTTTTSTSTERIGSTERAIGADFVPRDIIKFELADAKVPDFDPQFHQRYQTQKSEQNSRPRQRKVRKSKNAAAPKNDESVAQTSESDKATSSTDQSGSDSRVLTIAHPHPATGAFDSRGVKHHLPLSVQKAINQALKQDFQIPFLDSVKFYFKGPPPKTTKLSSVHIPAGAKLFSDSRIKQWWTPYKSGPTSNVGKISITTSKPATSPSFSNNDYVAYPLLRSYPVQYSMNVASDLYNGFGYLYGDRLYQKNPMAKPYTYQKNVNQVNTVTAEVKPLSETVKPVHEDDDDTITGIYRTSSPPSIVSSTAPIVFPSSTVEPVVKKPQSFIKYYSAELPSSTTEKSAIPISQITDKETLNLINKAINSLKKHNPHLHVVPKRLEKDELIVHVTPKPEYFVKSSTTAPAVSEAFKDIITEKNLVYLNKIVGSKPVVSTAIPVAVNKHTHKEVINHAYLTPIEAPANSDDLYESGYAFGYRVRDYNTGNDFGHTQKRMVDGTTHGEYKILMPDGRTQNVKYKADDHGYHADVSYDV